jgi:hypothetical protein
MDTLAPDFLVAMVLGGCSTFCSKAESTHDFHCNAPHDGGVKLQAHGENYVGMNVYTQQAFYKTVKAK